MGDVLKDWLTQPDAYPRWFTVLVIVMGVLAIPGIVSWFV